MSEGTLGQVLKWQHFIHTKVLTSFWSQTGRHAEDIVVGLAGLHGLSGSRYPWGVFE